MWPKPSIHDNSLFLSILKQEMFSFDKSFAFMCDNVTGPYLKLGKCLTWTWFCTSAWYKSPLCAASENNSESLTCELTHPLPLCVDPHAIVRTVELSIATHEVVGRMSYYRYIPSIYKSYWPGLNRTLRSSSVPRHVPDIDYCGWLFWKIFYGHVRKYNI